MCFIQVYPFFLFARGTGQKSHSYNRKIFLFRFGQVKAQIYSKKEPRQNGDPREYKETNLAHNKQQRRKKKEQPKWKKIRTARKEQTINSDYSLGAFFSPQLGLLPNYRRISSVSGWTVPCLENSLISCSKNTVTVVPSLIWCWRVKN